MPHDESRTAMRDRVAGELAAETLARSGSLVFRATGSSMLPEIWPGDVLHVRPRGFHDFAIGDIALFRCYDGLVAHRIVERPAARVLIARGDTVPGPDPPVTEASLLGVVELVERGARRFTPRRNPGLLSRAIAALACRSLLLNRAFQYLQAARMRAFA